MERFLNETVEVYSGASEYSRVGFSGSELSFYGQK